MQRTEPDGIVLSCDFCGRDWDGQEPMLEGHHGAILCLPCLQIALQEKAPGSAETKFSCTLCLRFNIPSTVSHWTGRFPRPSADAHIAPGLPGDTPEIPAGQGYAIVCNDCITLAAKTLSKSPRTDWTWDPKQ